MRAATFCVVLAAMLAGCSSAPSPDRSEAQSTRARSSSPPPAIDASTLVPAQYPDCDRGEQILRYLTTGDNGGVPELDQAFADYVGVAAPLARAVASDWIDACNARSAEAEASLAAEASRAAESAAAARREAEVKATTERSCAAIGGVVNDGFLGGCVSTVPGNPSGQLGADCPSAWVGVDGAGNIVQSDLDFARENDPGCFR